MTHRIIRDLDARRREIGMTQVELASLSNTTQGHISTILNGSVNPSLPVLDRMLKAVGLRLTLSYGATDLEDYE